MLNQIFKIILVVVTISFSSINVVFAETFVKHGNNGTASCLDFCANGIRWPKDNGSMGACISAVISHKNESIACSNKPGHLPEGELTCTCEAGKLPIRANLTNTVGSHWHMETNVTLSKNGRIDGHTKTKLCQRKGFTGGVWVALMDKDTNVLHITKVKSYGVDGKGFDNRCQQRSAPWNENVSSNLAKKVGGIVIHHSHNPRARFTKEDVYEVIEKGAKIYTAM